MYVLLDIYGRVYLDIMKINPFLYCIVLTLSVRKALYRTRQFIGEFVCKKQLADFILAI